MYRMAQVKCLFLSFFRNNRFNLYKSFINLEMTINVNHKIDVLLVNNLYEIVEVYYINCNSMH